MEDEQFVEDLQALEVRDLHVSHPGITEHQSGALCEAAAVCLARHHSPPKQFAVRCDEENHTVGLNWPMPSRQVLSSQANTDDATRDGAYAISLLFVNNILHLVAVGRAEKGSGADWLVTRPETAETHATGFPILEGPDIYRLEVSGVDRGTLRSRMKMKEQQLLRGNSSCPGIAAVVGFERAEVQMRSVAVEEAAT